MAWETPIFDRTQADIDFALQKIEEWKTNPSGVYNLKGCFNAKDMNRIENNIRYLSDTLSELYYFSTVTTKTWDSSGLPTTSDIERLIQNALTIISSICEDTPELPTTLLTFEDVNCLELNINKLKMILDDMSASFLECDTFECGEG